MTHSPATALSDAQGTLQQWTENEKCKCRSMQVPISSANIKLMNHTNLSVAVLPGQLVFLLWLSTRADVFWRHLTNNRTLGRVGTMNTKPVPNLCRFFHCFHRFDHFRWRLLACQRSRGDILCSHLNDSLGVFQHSISSSRQASRKFAVPLPNPWSACVLDSARVASPPLPRL